MAQQVDPQALPRHFSARLTRREFLRKVGIGGLGLVVANSLLVGLAVATGSADRIYRGVRLAGVDLSNMAPADATARVEAAVTAYQAQPLTVRPMRGKGEWRITPAELGMRYDVGAGVAAALAVGRDRSGVGNLVARLGAFLSGQTLTLPVALDEGKLEAYLHTWAADSTIWPVNARFTPGKDGGLALVPDQPGIGLDTVGCANAFLEQAARLAPGPVTLVQASVPAALSATRLATVQPQAEALLRQPVSLTLGGQRWTVPPDQLRAAFGYQLQGEQLVVALDAAPLQPFLDTIASAVTQPGVNARLTTDASGRFVVQPGQDGRVLDVPATLAALNAALTAGTTGAGVVLRPQPPAITAAALEPVRARAEQLANTQLVVTFAEYRRVFVRSDIQPLLVFTQQPGQTPPVALTLDPAGIRRLSEVIARDLDQNVQDAKFKWVNGQVEDVVKSQDGREVQLDATIAALTQAILAGSGTASPVVTVTAPKVASSQKQTMVVTDRLGYGRTDYSFSIPNRKWNVELSVQRLDGALIPPGGLFSFNETVGKQTVDSGYKEAYGIALVGGSGGGPAQVKTVTSIGGGICQVSTTLFQGVFHAGLPIEERNWHLYWIPGYGQPPSGMQGLDATVDSESKVDFKFRNTTGGWLAIEAVADGSYVRIAIYGKDPGWQVQIDPPVITNPRPADPKPQIEKTHNLPPGQQVVVEHAVDGFDAAIHRKVMDKNGKVIMFDTSNGPVPMDTTFKSTYQPSRNVTQVGVPANEPLN